MRKIDAHQHFWKLDQFDYPWLGPEMGILYRNYQPVDLAPLLTQYVVDGTIVVQATHTDAETDWLLSLAHDAPFIKGIVGWLDLRSPDLADRLARCIAQGPLCGIRHQVHDEPDPLWLLRDDVVRGLKTLAQAGIPYDLLLRPVHLSILPELFEAVPDMVWVIDHIAKPEITDQRMEPWLEGMKRAALYPNVYCKLSGMITEANWQHWTIEDIRPYFDQILAAFGPSRLLFGSDWPVCLLAGNYGRVNELLAQLISTLTEDEQAEIWSRTAQRVYKLALA